MSYCHAIPLQDIENEANMARLRNVLFLLLAGTVIMPAAGLSTDGDCSDGAGHKGVCVNPDNGLCCKGRILSVGCPFVRQERLFTWLMRLERCLLFWRGRFLRLELSRLDPNPAGGFVGTQRKSSRLPIRIELRFIWRFVQPILHNICLGGSDPRL